MDKKNKEMAEMSRVENIRMGEISSLGSEKTDRVGGKLTLNDQYTNMTREIKIKSMTSIDEKVKEEEESNRTRRELNLPPVNYLNTTPPFVAHSVASPVLQLVNKLPSEPQVLIVDDNIFNL
jgi:hypothetical protein